MIEISSWMEQFTSALTNTFSDRVWFVGLQGSYGRGEATDTSDIDVVVILDALTVEDIQVYDAMLNTLPHRELICGFLSGKAELLHWEPSDLFQFCHDTTPVKGSLEDVIRLIDDAAVDRAIKIGLCNIYHSCVHNMLHDKNEDILKSLYKSASFVVQAMVFQKTGRYFRSQKDMLPAVSEETRAILETFHTLKTGGNVAFAQMSQNLFQWTQKKLNE